MNAEIDINQRFKLKKVNYCLYNNEKYISSLSLQLSTNNGQSYQHDILRYKTNNVSDLIDKSGYILFYHREALRRSAENIRHEKAKNKYLSIDNTEKINNLQVLIMQKKQEITGFLTDATTADELCIVNKKLSYFRGLESIFRHFESLVKFDREKKFNSIESFNNSYNDILSELNAI